jgi:hypothetical protein
VFTTQRFYYDDIVYDAPEPALLAGIALVLLFLWRMSVVVFA